MERTPNAEQQRVIEDVNRNIILFASAGTGKTFTVANRIQNILNRGLAKPSEILCLTFTVKACEEMREDIARYAGRAAAGGVIKTIHSFCLSVLKAEAKKRNDCYTDIDVCDDVDEADLLKRLLTEQGTFRLIADNLKGNAVGLTAEEVFAGDMAFTGEYPKSLCRAVTKNGKTYTVTDYGKNIAEGLPRGGGTYICPVCGNRITERLFSVCGRCGTDLRTGAEFFPSILAEDACRQLCNIVSEIKYCRYKQNFFSDDEEADYRRTVDYMQQKNRLSGLFTFYNNRQRKELQDSTLLHFFLRHGGAYMHAYGEALRHSNYLDYDDLIILAAKLLEDRETREYWQGRFKFITVDEMQDTNAVEYEALERIFGNNRIMMCGDFFQTIYGWRGSDPEKVLQKYINGYNAVTYMFRENYRATRYLANASFGFLKNMYPTLIGKYSPGELTVHSRETGTPIQCLGFAGEAEEARFVFDYVRQHLPEDPTTLCVMARTNSILAQLANRFDTLNNSLPYEKQLRFFTVERNQQFYKTPVVKDLLAMLRIITNKTDTLSMDRIASRYITGVGEKTVEHLHGYRRLGLDICAFLREDTYQYGDNCYSLLKAAEEGNIVVYDTETTGLDVTKVQAIQIAAVRFDRNGNPMATFNEIVIPTVEISQGARDTVPFDVDEEIRRRGIPAKEAYEKFSAFVKGSVLVGHNSDRYDAQLVSRQLKELGLKPIQVIAQYDTLLLAKQFCDKLPNYKLSTLCDRFHIVNEDAHNAFGDVNATGAVLFKLIEEGILPARPERQRLIRKYAGRFQRFFAYIQDLERRLQTDTPIGIAKDIVTTLRLEKRYNSLHATRTVSEILRMIELDGGGDAASYFSEFISNASLSGSQMDGLIKKMRQVPMITVHQSKGCEFNTVIIVGAHDGAFPSWLSRKDPKDMQEEPRVFYVAISRAKKELILTYPYTNENGNILSPSRYIAKIPGEYRTNKRPED